MHLRLPCNPASPGLAREFVLGALEREGEAEVGDVATLLVSELVTNAYLHARSPVRVEVECRDRAVQVAVSDQSSQPAQVLPNVESRWSTGRGMQLVEALADEWGSDFDGEGKTIWFSIERDGH